MAAGGRDNNLLLVDLGTERHRCGTPTDCYYDHGTPWCFVCWDGNTPTPWQDLIDQLGGWQTDMLVRRAARAYHEMGRLCLVS